MPLKNLQKLFNDVLNTGKDALKVQQTGSNAELSSSKQNADAETVETYNLAEGAKQIEIFVESGSIRIRTDGNLATAESGEPLESGWAAGWAAESVSVYYVEDSVITVVIR